MIIGITGTQGAGKGTVSAYLVQKYNAKHFSVSDLIKEHVVASGQDVNRDTMCTAANEARREHGSEHFIKQLHERAVGGQHELAIIESVRTLGEATYLEEQKDFMLLAVDADQRRRYKHIQSRGSKKDDVDFVRFVAQESAEAASDDPSAQNITGCVARADYTVTNNRSLEELYAQVDDIMKKIA